MITGKGYFFFPDKANRNRPQWYKDHGLDIKAAQLCDEITLHSSEDYTYTCVLASMNALYFDDWKDTDAVFIATVFLDCVAQEFIERAKNIAGLEKAVAAKQKEMGPGTTPEEARAAIEQMRAAAISREKGELPSGELDLGAAASRSINSLDNLTKVMSATASDGFKKLNDELGNSVKDSLPKFNNFLKEMATPEGTIKKIGDVFESGKETIKGAVKEATEIPVTTKKRQTGSLGATGKIFEDFGAGELVELHGKEAVMTEQQLRDVVSAFSSRMDSNGEKWYTNNETQLEFLADSPQGRRVSELLRTIETGVTGADGVFQHAYSPETMTKAAKSLSNITSKELNTTLKDMGVTGFSGSPTTIKKEDNEINAALGMKQKIIDATMNQKTFDPLKNMPGMGNALKSWQSSLTSELKEPPKEKDSTTNAAAKDEQSKKPEQQQSDQTTLQPADKTTMTDVKDELVKLNMSIKELISHTDRVVDGVSRQTKVFSNSMTGSRI